MKAFVTKYALTYGIKEIEAESVADGWIKTKEKGWEFIRPIDWYTTREVAVSRAEDMRQAKLNSLRKAIAKIEKLTF